MTPAFLNSVIGGTLVFLLCSCSSSQPPASSGGPSGRSSAAAAAVSGGASELAVASPRSVFQVDKEAIDPFFPRARRVAAAVQTAAAEPDSPIEIKALLQDGFQGVLGSGDHRIAIINNVMIEAGRRAVIPIGTGASAKQIHVRCLEVNRDSVMLEIDGHSQPVRVTRTLRLGKNIN